MDGIYLMKYARIMTREFEPHAKNNVYYIVYILHNYFLVSKVKHRHLYPHLLT